jgi:hypothetical protein
MMLEGLEKFWIAKEGGQTRRAWEYAYLLATRKLTQETQRHGDENRLQMGGNAQQGA